MFHTIISIIIVLIVYFNMYFLCMTDKNRIKLFVKKSTCRQVELHAVGEMSCNSILIDIDKNVYEC